MSDNNNDNEANHYLSLGIVFGLIFGGAVGVLFDNIAIGSGLGMLLGIVIGSVQCRSSSKKLLVYIITFRYFFTSCRY